MRCRFLLRPLLAGLVLGLVAVQAGGGSVLACTSEQPSFQQAVDGADFVVDARVIAVQKIVSEPDTYVLAVDRVLRGQAGVHVVLKGARTGLCGDQLDIQRLGQRIIIAVGVDFFDQEISPYWAESEGQVYGSASMPFGARSLDDIAWSIARLKVPAVSPSEAGSGAWPLVAIAVAGLAGVLVAARWRSRRGRGRTPGT